MTHQHYLGEVQQLPKVGGGEASQVAALHLGGSSSRNAALARGNLGKRQQRRRRQGSVGEEHRNKGTPSSSDAGWEAQEPGCSVMCSPVQHPHGVAQLQPQP